MRIPIALVLVSAICVAQPAPRITFEALHYDFGKIPTDNKVTHQFKVTNTGQAPLNITRVHASCGCTSTVAGKWTLAPGETTEVEVTFNPAGYRGPVRKSVQVTSDDPANPDITLTFEAECIQEIMPSTTSVFFQDVVRTTPRKASVKLVSGTGKPVKLVRAEAKAAPWLKADCRPDGNDAWVDITLDGTRIPPDRTLGADAIFVTTENPKVPNITLTVQWELRPFVTAEPLRVAWSEPAGKELRTTVVLKQVDNKPFRILAAKTTNPKLLTVELPPSGQEPSPSQEIQVILGKEAAKGLYTEKVMLTLAPVGDDKARTELEVRVSAALR